VQEIVGRTHLGSEIAEAAADKFQIKSAFFILFQVFRDGYFTISATIATMK
jgi:hypothetical protein